MSSSSKTKQTMNRQKQMLASQERLAKPSAYQANVAVSRRYRFQSGAGTYSITPRTLLQAAGVCADTAILAQSVWSSVKLNAIEVWGPLVTAAPITVSVQWNGSAYVGSQAEVADSSTNPNHPAHVYTSPPKQSLASFWQIDNTAVIAAISVPANSIVDIYLSLVMIDGTQNAAANPLVTVGNTPGLIYYYPADGRGGGLTPIALSIGG